MFHVGELACAAQYQMPVVIVVFNDGGYGVLRGLQVNQFDGRFNETELRTPDFVQLAESMGVKGLKADSAAEFDNRLDEAMQLEGGDKLSAEAQGAVPEVMRQVRQDIAVFQGRDRDT